jgi:S-DNA-T family DNA segregation ATPase FtsK/SpoIIIE
MADRIYNTNPFNRPPRLQNNFRPVDIDIPAPPVKPDETARNLLMSLLPMSSFLVMGLFYALAFGRGSGGMGWLYAVPMLGIAVFSFVIAYITFGEQKYEQKQRWLKQLRDYHRLLDKKESRLLAARSLQSDLLMQKFQSPREILRRVKNLEITIWERRREDPDFLALRLGLGEANSINNVKPPDPDLNIPDIRRAFGMYVEYRKIPNAPVVIDLQKLGSVALVGNRNFTTPLMRALITQVCTLNSPDDVHIYMFSSEAYYKTWKWLRWLPHTSESHIGGHPSFMAFTPTRSKELLASIAKLLDVVRQSSEEAKSANFQLSHSALLLFDNEKGVQDELSFLEYVKNGKSKGIYSIFLCEKLEDVPSDCSSVIEIDNSGFVFSVTGTESLKSQGRPDKVALIETDNLSHRLLPIAIRTLGRNSSIPTRVNFLQMYDVEQIEQLRIEERWAKSPAEDGLLPFKIRLGSETYADPLIVNLSENNDGPHGLIAGTTGSGKSELLQTLVSSLALEHHPYFLNFMLIDFKGASTFGVFEKMPHVVGLVSNLDKLSAGRALEALKAENLRRQNFLRKLKIVDIIEYHQRLLGSGKILDPLTEPLSHLFIIVDEFAQMASEMPGFLDSLNEIARVGRSLGIHLVLATQRPAGVVKDEMRANLNFRISLRVQSIDDSRDMLRRPDAAFLPHDLPGRAYFQLGDSGTPRQFQVARAGTEYQVVAVKDQRYNLYRINYEEDDLILDGLQIKKKNTYLFSINSDLANDLDTGLSNQIRESFFANGKTLSTKASVVVEESGIQWVIEDIDAKYGIKKDEKDQQLLKVSKITLTITKVLVEKFTDIYKSMLSYKPMDQILLPPLGEEVDIEVIAFNAKDSNLWKDWWCKGWDEKWKEQPQTIKLENRKKEPSVFQIPIGLLDSLATRSQPPHYLDFLEHGGHVMLIGGAQSGKTYFLQSLCYSIATHYNPSQANVYILSFAGKDLDLLAELPHVGSVIDGSETEKIHRLIRYLQNEVDKRKKIFNIAGVKDLYDYNAKARQVDQLPYICILIDNFGELRTLEYDSELAEIEKLLKIGRLYGLHFIITALQGNDIPSKLSNLIQHRIAFNLSDHSEYLLLVGRPESLEFDTLPKGRCFVNIANPPMSCQIGKPPEKHEWDVLINEMNLVWGARNKPLPINVLSGNEPLSGLLGGAESTNIGMRGIVGLDGDDLSTYWIDWKKETPHFLVGGPSQSGRTSLLHTFVLGLSHNYSPEQLNIVLVDGSRSLRDLQKLPHVIGWVTEEEGFVKNIANLFTELDYRRSHLDQLPNLPELLFVVDDYDLTCEAFNINEIILSKIGKRVRQDSDLGFHLLISVLPENVAHPDLLIKQVRLSRTGISLATADTLENLGGRPTSIMRNEELPAGRGYFFARSTIKLLQFANPDNQANNRVVEKWIGRDKADWARQATPKQIEQVRKESESAVKADGSQQTSSVPTTGSFINMDKAVEAYIKQQQMTKKGAK